MSRKEYNPNTKYGRKKLREQAREEYERMTPEEKEKHNTFGCITTFIILIIICGIIFIFSGSEGLLKWLTR